MNTEVNNSSNENSSSVLIPFYVEKLVAMSIIISISLLNHFYVPFYPTALAIGLTVGWVAISAKSHVIGLTGMIVTMGFSFSYQFSKNMNGQIGLYMLLLMILLAALSFSLTAKSIKGLFGTGLGLIAGLLMLTPYFFYAMPLLIITSFCYKGISRLFAFIFYILIYLPFVFLEHIQKQISLVNFAPKIYQQISPSFSPQFESVNSAFIQNFLLMSSENLYAESIVILSKSYFLYNFSLLLLSVLIISSISSTYVLDGLASGLQKHGRNVQNIRNYLHLPSNFIGLMVFFLPLIYLSNSIGYQPFELNYIQFGSLLLFLFIGGVASGFTNNYFVERKKLLDLRFIVKLQGVKIFDMCSEALASVNSIASTVRNIALEDVKSNIEGIKEKSDLFLSTYLTLSSKNLEEEVENFKTLPENLDIYNKLIRRRLLDYFITFDRSYNNHLVVLDNMGIKLPPLVPEVRSQEVGKLSNERILTAYQDFGKEIHGIISSVVSTGESFMDVLKNNFDSTYDLTTVPIARSLLNEEDYEKSLEIIAESLTLMHNQYGKVGFEMLDKLGRSSKLLRQKLETHIRPFINEFGAQQFLDELDIMNTLDDIISSYKISDSIIDIALLPEIKSKFNNCLIRLITTIDVKLTKLEKTINSNLPKNFIWNQSYSIHDMSSLAIRSLKEDSIKLGQKSIESLDNAIDIIETLSNTLDHYLTMREFTLNYHNVESIILSRLEQLGTLKPHDIKVKHSDLYLKLFASKHPSIIYDSETKTLIGKNIPLLDDTDNLR